MSKRRMMHQELRRSSRRRTHSWTSSTEWAEGDSVKDCRRNMRIKPSGLLYRWEDCWWASWAADNEAFFVFRFTLSFLMVCLSGLASVLGSSKCLKCRKGSEVDPYVYALFSLRSAGIG
jgi:hypothetical protein